MAKNFPEIWLKRVRQNLTNADRAPWLAGIGELDAPVTELGAGSASEKNIIHIPTTTFEPDVLLNNTTYPLSVQDYSDDDIVLSLDKYQTKPTSVADDAVVGASYNKIDTVTGTHTRAILKKKYAKAIHALAPDEDSDDTPIIEATGDDDPTGRPTLTYEDLISLKRKINNLEADSDLRLVLSDDHLNDLLLDRKNFGDQLVNYKAGEPAPIIAGFQIYSYSSNPFFASDTGKKVAFASAPGATDHRASVCFMTTNVAKKTGLTKQYFEDAKNDTQNQQNLLAYRHYFICLPVMKKYIGAIISKEA